MANSPHITLEDALQTFKRMTEAHAIERSRQFILSRFHRHTLTVDEAEQLLKAPGLDPELYTKLRRIARGD
jgi:hypothetical protein